ncbi:hypothetical protein [Mucilaginibacter sp.]|uniref:hypothetical protein n=1 Tax=Mucilaginibacter sp. TaxID=1882438 RepID=UPI002841DF93|nr:hypothetical protein [Mucilaginibacter sp.]MDR3696978.1 hypothetical protein [Mucilaginibacter sp.]
MKPRLFLLLLLFTLKGFAQPKPLEGIVFDKESKERIAKVNIHDLTNGIAIYDNLKGEYQIIAADGDVLVFSKQNYRSDTIKVQSRAQLAVYMVRLAIQLKEVTVHNTNLTPDQKLEATKNDFTKIYGSLAYGDYLSTPYGGGAGLSIDALWNSISRSGRNASKLRDIIQQDYEQNVIDYRFNREYVAGITGLKDDKLTSFMFRYRPGYYTASSMSDYEFITMIRANLHRFLRNQRTYGLPALVGK